MEIKNELQLGWTGTEWVWAPFPYTDDLAQSKAFMVNTTNATAYSILQPTDWYVVRNTENGEEVPLQINSWRQKIRDEAKAKVYKINATTTKDELLTYTTNVEYETWSNEPVIPAE
jgi:hypothetical protein